LIGAQAARLQWEQARAEDPGLSKAEEAAEAVPTESVRSKRKSEIYVDFCS